MSLQTQHDPKNEAEITYKRWRPPLGSAARCNPINAVSRLRLPQ